MPRGSTPTISAADFRAGKVQSRPAPQENGGVRGKPILPPIYRKGGCDIRILDMEGKRVNGRGGIRDLEQAHRFLDQAAADRTILRITIERVTE